jgi:hypothetical protein
MDFDQIVLKVMMKNVLLNRFVRDIMEKINQMNVQILF